jgi:AhpD family alkylhydroperoxidase
MAIRIDQTKVAPGAYKALLAAELYARQSGLERSLLELVKLRASYMNGCAFCVDMHSKDALQRGETTQRLLAIPVWRETPFFTPRERAALAWTETVTDVSRTHVPDAAYDEAREQFTEFELVNLTMAITAINAWNRVSISFRAEPGSYQIPATHTA